MNRELLGPDHQEIAANLNVLGMIADDRGEHEAALSHKIEALRIVRNYFDPGHVRIGLQTQSTATTWLALGRCDQAEPLFDDAIEVLMGSQPHDGPVVAFARAASARCLVQSGRLVEAEERLVPSHAILQDAYGDEDRRTRQASETLAELRSRTAESGG